MLSVPFKLSREAFGGAHATVVYQVLDNRFLGGEVIEQRPDGDICVASNVAGRGLFEPFLRKLLLGNF